MVCMCVCVYVCVPYACSVRCHEGEFLGLVDIFSEYNKVAIFVFQYAHCIMTKRYYTQQYIYKRFLYLAKQSNLLRIDFATSYQ